MSLWFWILKPKCLCLKIIKSLNMLVVVRINQCLVGGGTVAACAYRAWGLNRLLTDATLRNSSKYLVALNGSVVEGIFCIKGVAPDPLPGKVQFAIEPVSRECFLALEPAISDIYHNTRLIKMVQRARYINEEHFRISGIEIPEIKCCDLGNIPVLEPNQIEQYQRPI